MTNVKPSTFTMAIRITSIVFLALFPLFQVACYANLLWNRNRLEKRIKSAIYVASLAGWLAYFNLIVSNLGGVPCGIFYATSLLVAPLSAGPQIIRALTLRGMNKYYHLVAKEEISSRISRSKAPSESIETGVPLASGKAEATLIMERTKGIVKTTIFALLVTPILLIIFAITVTSDVRKLLETDFIQCLPEPISFQYANPALGITSTVLALGVPYIVRRIDDELHLATEIRRNSIFLGCTHISIVVMRVLGVYDEWQPLMQTIQQMCLSTSTAIIPFLPSSPTFDRISSWAMQRGKRIKPEIKGTIPGYGRPLPKRDSTAGNVIERRMTRRLSAVNIMIEREAVVSWDAGLCVLLSSEDGINMFIQHCSKEFSSENILFWCAVNDYKEKYDKEKEILNDIDEESVLRSKTNSNLEDVDIEAIARQIYLMFIDTYSASQVNLSSKQKGDIKRALDAGQLKRETFDAAQKEIFSVMSRDSYPRFLSSKKKMNR
ncbi:hypothetical protein ACHAXA_005339 [Cyclostephanos tholiformis]|uniref:RGS domain-containing protein n=1 Tax=Cyclostephanos tholiformis TaxID=382380 RepID=A0ABD3R672_9STRA